jgi:hypothetical protein
VAYINLDAALATLNVARFWMNPARFPIFVFGDHLGVAVEPADGDTNGELDALTEVTIKASETVTAWLAENPGMMIVEDHKGRWVAIRAA